MRTALALLALAALLVVVALPPPATAALNGERDFEADFGYSAGFDDTLRLVSGHLAANVTSAGGTYGFFNVSRVVITGLTQACWSAFQCVQSGQPEVAIVVTQGGGFALSLPEGSDFRLGAAHAMGLFMDFGDDDLNTLTLGRSLIAPLVGGEADFTRITPIPRLAPGIAGNPASIAALDAGTVLDIYRDDTLIVTRSGKVEPITFTGQPLIEAFTSDFAVLPLADGGVVQFEPAPGAAADAGLHLARIREISQLMASAESEGDGQRDDLARDLGGFDKVLSEVLNGAILALPGNNTPFSEAFVLVRFSELDVTASARDLEWEGRAVLAVQDGRVDGAEPLYGFWYFALPWWSYVLWIFAIGAFVVRLVLQSPKKSERWEKFRWIGWLATPAAWFVVLLLWDFEIRTVWGTSILSTDSSGAAFWVTVLVQLATLSLILFAAAAPLRVLARNALRIARQGTFMNLSTSISTLVGYVLGAHLLLSYLELILVQVIETLG